MGKVGVIQCAERTPEQRWSPKELQIECQSKLGTAKHLAHDPFAVRASACAATTACRAGSRPGGLGLRAVMCCGCCGWPHSPSLLAGPPAHQS